MNDLLFNIFQKKTIAFNFAANNARVNKSLENNKL